MSITRRFIRVRKVSDHPAETFAAMITLGSENRKSLMIEFDRAVYVEGGMYAGAMALSFDDAAGVYRDLISGEAFEVTWPE